MSEPSTDEATFLDWAVAARPRPGQERSGDVATLQSSGSRCIVAVVDGLGHGPEAADAAELVTQIVEQDPEAPLEVLFHRSHERLAETRGAAATIAIIDGRTGRLDWLGVGNVDGMVVRADESVRPRTRGVFLCRGVLGYRLPNLHTPEPVALQDGDCIVINTDGISGNLVAEDLRGELPVTRIAGDLLAARANADDDALVFVARYRAGLADDA